MRILVVDDEAQVRSALRVMLEGAGFEVAEAGGGAEALRALREVIDLLPLANKLGADGVLYKPVDRAAALAVLDRILRATR